MPEIPVGLQAHPELGRHLEQAPQSERGIRRDATITTVAIDTLAALLGRGVPPAVRLGAARTVAELAIHEHDADTIGQRLRTSYDEN